MDGYDHFRPPEHLTPIGKIAFRVVCSIAFTIAVSIYAYFTLPLVYEYVSRPLGEWTYETVRGWTGEPQRYFH